MRQILHVLFREWWLVELSTAAALIISGEDANITTAIKYYFNVLSQKLRTRPSAPNEESDLWSSIAK